MAIEWSVDSDADVDLQAVIGRTTELVRSIPGWNDSALKCYENRVDFEEGKTSNCRKLHETPVDQVIIGDHTRGTYVEVSRFQAAGLTSYTTSARRDTPSMLTALLISACLAELTDEQIVDDGKLTGKASLAPADLITAIHTISQKGEPLSAHQVGRALGLTQFPD